MNTEYLLRRVKEDYRMPSTLIQRIISHMCCSDLMDFQPSVWL